MTTPTPLPLDGVAMAAFYANRRNLEPKIADAVYDQALAALTLAARVAELEAELARAKWDVAARNAHANALREALQDCFEWFDARADVDHVGDPMRPFPNAEAIQREHVLAALASTPAASLAAHDAEVLERAIKAIEAPEGECEGLADCESNFGDAYSSGFDDGLRSARNSVRALAAQAATHSVPGGTSEVKP